MVMSKCEVEWNSLPEDRVPFVHESRFLDVQHSRLQREKKAKPSRGLSWRVQ